MKTLLKLMKKQKNEIPSDKLMLFEHIVQSYQGSECEEKFLNAMEEQLTKEQRFRLFEQHGSCSGTKYDKDRIAFSQEHTDKPLAERLELFTRTFGRTAILNDDNTITVSFACNHGYYKHAPKGNFKYSRALEAYFERCAGGRLYEIQKALGIKLRIKSVDISSLSINILNPVVFTFEIIA